MDYLPQNPAILVSSINMLLPSTVVSACYTIRYSISRAEFEAMRAEAYKYNF